MGANTITVSDSTFDEEVKGSSEPVARMVGARGRAALDEALHGFI